MEADSLKADNKKIWIRGQFVEVTDESIDITLHYAHMFPSAQKDMAEKLNMERVG